MSGSTPAGLPYPTGTDLVRDGDNAIKALAEAVNTMVQGGGAIVTTNSGGDANLSFPRPFRAGTAPHVVPANGDPGATSNALIIAVWDTLTNNTNFNINIRRDDGLPHANAACRVKFIAVGVAP